MAADYLEAIAVWAAGSPRREAAAAWAAEHGLSAAPMQAGLLLSGTADRFGAAFGVDTSSLQPGTPLPIPAELHGVFDSVTFPRERGIRVRGGG